VAVKWVLSFDGSRGNVSLISVRLARALETILEVSARLRLSGLVMTVTDAEINKLASLLRKLLVESEGPLLSENVPARLGGSPLLLTLATQAWLQFRHYISGAKSPYSGGKKVLTQLRSWNGLPAGFLGSRDGMAVQSFRQTL